MKRPQETDTFTFDTSSKKPNQRSSDCVIRAISLATGFEWVLVFDDLCKIARKIYRVPNEKNTYERYLERLGWKKRPMPKHEDGTRFTARELAVKYKNQTIIMSLANHLTCSINGKIHDIWDCGEKAVGNYWVR